jgi:hypothetical protein
VAAPGKVDVDTAELSLLDGRLECRRRERALDAEPREDDDRLVPLAATLPGELCFHMAEAM